VPWVYAVIENEHELQNPTSEAKIRLLGERLRLRPESHVLDVASGRAGPALVLARAFGCRITCVERSPDFHAAAQERVAAAGLAERIELVNTDASQFALEPELYDAALCLGASFVWGGLDATVAALAPAVKRRGFVAVGEPYWRVWPLPGEYDPGPYEGFVTLDATVARVEAQGLRAAALIASSVDDWDRYKSLHWLVAEEWLHEHPDDPDAASIRDHVERERLRYLRWDRDLLGWAIVVGRKP
jgi:hypothetical protein